MAKQKKTGADLQVVSCLTVRLDHACPRTRRLGRVEKAVLALGWVKFVVVPLNDATVMRTLGHWAFHGLKLGVENVHPSRLRARHNPTLGEKAEEKEEGNKKGWVT